MWRPDDGRQTRLEGLLWPRADSRRVRKPARQAQRPEGDRGQRQLRLEQPALRQRDEPVGTRCRLQTQADARVRLALAFAIAGSVADPQRMQVIVVAILF